MDHSSLSVTTSQSTLSSLRTSSNAMTYKTSKYETPLMWVSSTLLSSFAVLQSSQKQSLRIRLDVRTFCQITFCDNILVLFDLFDFNMLNSISITDLEFMINSCINSTFKIYTLPISEVDNVEINNLVNTSFDLEKRITVV